MSACHKQPCGRLFDFSCAELSARVKHLYQVDEASWKLQNKFCNKQIYNWPMWYNRRRWSDLCKKKSLGDSENVNVKQDKQYVCRTKRQASARYKTVQALLVANKAWIKNCHMTTRQVIDKLVHMLCQAFQANQKHIPVQLRFVTAKSWLSLSFRREKMTKKNAAKYFAPLFIVF